MNLNERKFSVIVRKRRSPPVQLPALLAALHRLPETHQKYHLLKQRIASTQAGYGGEQELDKVLENYSFPMPLRVFQDISLSSSSLFQIDTLILTPEFALICEVKNMSGELSITENPPQLLRVSDDGQLTGFPSPISQLLNTCQLFEDWLIARDTPLPVYGCVVLAYPKQRLTLFDTDVPVLFPSTVPMHIRSLYQEHPLLLPKELDELSVQILHAHRNFKPKPISVTYDIHPDDFLTGVACPSCGHLGMIRNRKVWKCKACGTQSSSAHQQTIHDWFLLFDGALTNAEYRRFCRLPCQQTARRMLLSMNLIPVGAKKNRSYRKSPMQ